MSEFELQDKEGCVGMLKSKSGLNCHYGITGEGVIDSGYTGSIHGRCSGSKLFDPIRP